MNSWHFETADDEFAMNPTKRLPVCLCLDLSGSMNDTLGISNNKKIDKLNEGIKAFYKAIKNDEVGSLSADVAIVTFNNEIKVAEEFGMIATKTPKEFKAANITKLGGGLEKALQLCERRKNEYIKSGQSYFQPWIVIISDGAASDVPELKVVTEKMRRLQENKKLTVYSLAVGDDCDMNALNALAINGAHRLQDLEFEKYFQWLSQSIDATATSNSGEVVESKNKSGWAREYK